MSHEHPDDHDHDHDHDHEESGLTIDTQTHLFLEMRRQNVDLLQLASRIAGYAGDRGPLKPEEIRNGMERIWEIYRDLYQWVDPEEDEDEA